MAARVEPVGQVELRRKMRILADTDVLAIELDDEHALGGADMEDDAPSGLQPGGRDLEVALVDARRVLLGDLGRPSRERHLDVRVMRLVPGVRHRPQARDLGLGPVGSGRAIRRAEELETPPAVELDSVEMVDAVHGQATDPRHLGEGPRSGHEHDCPTLGQTVEVATPDPVMIRATGLGRSFGPLWAVRGMDLEVRRGEVLGLLGPNGAGKTTTVRMLTALIAPSEGHASVDGLDVVDEPEGVRARVGILTETPGLYDKLTAIANLDFFGRLYGLDAGTRATRIERYLRLFSLWERRDDVAGTFSKGMKQKLAIARALLHEPAVVFLDEPTAALDPEAAYVVREAIESMRRSGRTIVLATHNLDEADRLCDRVAFVRGGLLRIDSPAGLRGSLGGRGVEIGLASTPGDALVATARTLPGITSVEAVDHRLVLAAPDPAAVTPALVRALVNAGADITAVHERATTLEQVYFEVMGARPDRGEAT